MAMKLCADFNTKPKRKSGTLRRQVNVKKMVFCQNDDLRMNYVGWRIEQCGYRFVFAWRQSIVSWQFDQEPGNSTIELMRNGKNRNGRLTRVKLSRKSFWLEAISFSNGLQPLECVLRRMFRLGLFLNIVFHQFHSVCVYLFLFPLFCAISRHFSFFFYLLFSGYFYL